MTSEHEVETTDIYRGAYLLCRGGRVGRMAMGHGGQVVFVIEGEGLTEEDMRYRTGNALVNPLQLRETLNLLRDMVFDLTGAGRRANAQGRGRGGRGAGERDRDGERDGEGREVHGAHTAGRA